MRETILNELLLGYEARRLENERTELARKEEIRRKVPRVAELAAERENLIRRSLKEVLAGNRVAGNLPEQVDRLSAEIRKALKTAGYPENYLEPVYRCPACRDTGYVGELVRNPCDCLRRAYQQRLRRDIGLDIREAETFRRFDPSVFSEEPLKGSSLSQRAYMNEVRKICENWAGPAPEGGRKDLLLLGPSGVGKTFLLRCMADRLLEQDVPVLLVSAGRFFEMARSHYFGQDSDLEDLRSVEVLMLDDLGSEPLMQNITIESLFDLIETRRNRGLATAFSTNLSEEELRARYTERIASRMTYGGKCVVIPLQGRDIRRAGRRASVE